MSWEEEFDKRFSWQYGYNFCCGSDTCEPDCSTKTARKLKSFLKETVEKAEQRGVEKAVKYLARNGSVSSKWDGWLITGTDFGFCKKEAVQKVTDI